MVTLACLCVPECACVCLCVCVSGGGLANMSCASTSVIGNVSIAWIKKVVNEDPARPFFAHIAPKAAHEPFNPAPWYNWRNAVTAFPFFVRQSSWVHPLGDAQSVVSLSCLFGRSHAFLLGHKNPSHSPSFTHHPPMFSL